MPARRKDADDPYVVDARPEKRFFIYMLVKDIELIPAIIDLVDNSVDGARGVKGGPDASLEGLFVHLEVTPERFSITDNCGGMEAETARRYAFRFGRPEKFTGVESAVGQFGVGMKRAFFKLGKTIEVDSVARTSKFRLKVDVDKWAEDRADDWTFKFDSVTEDVRNRVDRCGTKITVTDLHETVSEDFGRDIVLGTLRADLQLRHQQALAAGLEIVLNGEVLSARLPTLVTSDDIMPINKKMTIDTGAGVIEMRVVAGLAPAPRGKDEPEDVGDAEHFTDPSEAGWYLFGNGRLVFAADKTVLTGWGASAAAYHPQYRRFRGFVYLWARDASLLPWNTTKTGVDQDSPVFRQVQQEMYSALSAVVGLINRMKKEAQEQPPRLQVLNNAVAAARPARLESLPASTTLVAPATPRTRTPPQVINVQYRANRADVELAMNLMGVHSAREMGQRSLEYYLEAEA